MITTDGRQYIKGFLAGYYGSIARSIAFGLGEKAEEVTDRRLQFEVGRADIIITSYDYVNDRLIFKAELPGEYAGTITEVALFSTTADVGAGEFGSKLISSFDSATEDWFTAGVESTFSFNARLGFDSLAHTPAASASTTSELNEILTDFSGYSGADEFLFAYNVGNANTSDITITFRTDAANYFTFSLGAQSAGYKVESRTKASAAVTGNPSWESITGITVTTTSGAGGASDVYFDGIRIEDSDSVSADYVMISRELLPEPFVKQNSSTQEVEFALQVVV